mmetsp:Transcript_63117/g.137172  ORF Transcript_63117/g.137172 Transcript_63117/m.137172 type:complete len:457 (+) Transcript_63117:62-1432(+)
MASRVARVALVILQAAVVKAVGASRFAAEGREYFKSYCNHERRWTGPPVKGTSLEQVLLVHRHGARTPWQRVSCWAPAPGEAPRELDFTCPMKMSVGIAGRRPVRKVYSDRGQCGIGSLLPEAAEQFEAVAASLNATYGNVPWWRTLNPADETSVHLYSCDNERNLGSIDLLVTSLFPESRGLLSVHTLPPDTDPWQLPDHVWSSPCPQLFPDVKLREAIVVNESYLDFKRRWRIAANANWHVDHYDCVLTARCSGAAFPENVSSELAHEGLYWDFQENFASKIEWTSVQAARAMTALLDRLVSQAQGDGVRLGIYSTHDTTMMWILRALDAWDGRWIRYAGVVAFELHKLDGRHFVRLLSNGEPLIARSCGNEELCPLDNFTQIVRRWSEAAALCLAPAALDILAESSSLPATYGPDAALLAIPAGLCLCLLLGWVHRWQSARLSRGVTSRPLLG